MLTRTPQVVLTIAGFDPSSGAGVTADIKTIAAHGCYGVAGITALTVQSTQGVRGVHATNPEILAASLSELASDLEFGAVHIGMLASTAVAGVVADFLHERQPPNVVVDPVLKSSSGFDLLAEPGIAVLIRRFFPLAKVITPNIDEASTLSGINIRTRDDTPLAARKLHELGVKGVVITGGHLPEDHADLLSLVGESGIEQVFFPVKILISNATHGTGCAFSTALACHLALGRPLSEAVPLAQEYVGNAMAESYPIGRGRGPINHLYRR